MNRPTTPASLPYCAGISALGGLCKKHGQCAIYRKWWETPGTDAKKCESGKYDRFVPLASTVAATVGFVNQALTRVLACFIPKYPQKCPQQYLNPARPFASIISAAAPGRGRRGTPGHRIEVAWQQDRHTSGTGQYAAARPQRQRARR